MDKHITATLDLTGCDSWQELHRRIKVALQFPDYYGGNWDAFWDSLTIDSPVEYVRIIGEHTVPECLCSSLEQIHSLLAECKKHRNSFGDFFDFEIID